LTSLTILELIEESWFVGVVFFTGVSDLEEFCLEIFPDTFRLSVAFLAAVRELRLLLVVDLGVFTGDLESLEEPAAVGVALLLILLFFWNIVVWKIELWLGLLDEGWWCYFF